MTDERADAALAAGGDTAAFERLYRRHHPKMHRMAAWMLGTEDTDDVIQEVFLRAWRKLPQFRGESTFGTWLHRLGMNVILRYARKGERATEQLSDTVPGRPVQPDLRMDLESAVGKLPNGARRVFVLYDIVGYRHDEIGTMLGISPHTSRAQLHRARTLLRGHL